MSNVTFVETKKLCCLSHVGFSASNVMSVVVELLDVLSSVPAVMVVPSRVRAACRVTGAATDVTSRRMTPTTVNLRG